MPFGQSDRSSFPTGMPASADGMPEYKTGGVTIDWTTARTAQAGTVTLEDETVIPAATQYLPPGTVLCRITASGKYGPHDPAAGDGRELLNRGETFILNYLVMNDSDRYPHKDNPPGAFAGGRVYTDRLRILVADAYTNTGAWSPDVQQALPRVLPVDLDV